MWLDQPYAQGRGSFLRPVVPPQVDPDASPTITVTLSCQWLPYVRGALKQLLLQATWQGTPADILLAQQRAFNLIDLFQECSSSVIPFACVGHLNTNSNPFGTFSIGCVGQYVPFIGYDATCGACGGSNYVGVDVRIDLGAAYDIDQVSFGYDMNRDLSNYPAGYYAVFAQALPGGSFIGTPLYTGGVVDGSGQSYDSGIVSPINTQIVRLFAACAVGGSCPGMGGSAAIFATTVTGSGITTPC